MTIIWDDNETRDGKFVNDFDDFEEEKEELEE